MADRLHFNACRFLLFGKNKSILCVLELARWEKHHCQRHGRCLAAEDENGKQITRKFFERMLEND